MIIDTLIQPQLQEHQNTNRRLVLGVSGASPGLIQSLSEHFLTTSGYSTIMSVDASRLDFIIRVIEVIR